MEKLYDIPAWNQWYSQLTEQAIDELWKRFHEFVDKEIEKEKQDQKKQGRWQECEIFIHNSCDCDRFKFKRDTVVYELTSAFSMVGFGGIQYKEIPDRWFSDLMFTDADGGDYCDVDNGDVDNRPATPTKVRFWVEG